MIDRYWGTLYLVRHGANFGVDDAAAAVVKPCDYAWSHIDVAKELWHLAGRDDKARAISDLLSSVMTRTDGRADGVMVAEEIQVLLGLLDGLDAALRVNVVDAHDMVPPEKLSELRARVELVDLDESRGPLAAFGVSEALGRVGELRSILEEAISRGLGISFG